MFPSVKGATTAAAAAAAAAPSSSYSRRGAGRPDARHEPDCRANNAALSEAYEQFLATLRERAAESDNEDQRATDATGSAAPNEQLGDFAAPNQGGSAKPDLKGVGDQPLPLLRVSHIDLRTKEHKTINIPGQRAGTLLLMFRHFARIGHHAGDAKKVSKKTRPKRMSYAGLEEFVKHWLEPKDLCSCSEDLPQMWQAVISNKMKEEGAQNHLDYFGPHDFTVFLMVAILAYKSKMRLVSTPRATRVFVEALCLELRPQLLQRLRNHYQAFTRPELGHYHEEVLLSETAKSPTQAPARPGDASPRHNVLHIRNFARDMAVAGELNRRFMYAVVTKEEAAWHHNSGILRLLQRDSRFHPAIMMKDIPAIQHVDLSFGVEIGKTYHVRFDILLSRPSEAVAAEDEADDYDPNDSAAAAAALADALQTHRQEFQLALSPKGNAAALRASVQSVQQISCIPAPASTTSANGMAGQGEDVELRLIITIRPTCAGIFTGNIDLQLIEGAGHNIDFKYKLPPVPYFVNVRHPGVRRPAKTAMAPTFTAGKQALPIIHNPRGGPGFSKAADFSRISNMRTVIGTDLSPSQKRELLNPKKRLIQRVQRKMHLANTLSKAFNFSSRDEEISL